VTLLDLLDLSLLESAERPLRSMARRLAVSYGQRHEQDEWEASAITYGVEALGKWQPGRGVKFATFATAYARQSLIRQHAKPRAIATQGLADCEGRSQDSPAETRNLRRPTREQARLLRALKEPARSYVRLVRFGGLSPAQVADQCRVPVKDVKLVLRNAYRQLCRVLDAEELEQPPIELPNRGSEPCK
jgi:DNA-directed RNA polymerase specialized sigma24 family protein